MIGLMRLWWMVLLIHPVICSLTCNSTCTASGNVPFPCVLLEIGEEQDPFIPEWCGPNRPSPITCDKEHINGTFQLGFSWHPPGDSSARDITGFRILIFIPIRQHFRPRKSYMMNLARSYLTEPCSTFSLRCLFDEESDRENLAINAFVYSLPKSHKKSCEQWPASCRKNNSELNSGHRLESTKQRESECLQSIPTDVDRNTNPTIAMTMKTKIAIGMPVALVSLVLVVLAVKRFCRGRQKTCFISSTEHTNGHLSASLECIQNISIDQRDSEHTHTIPAGQKVSEYTQTIPAGQRGSEYTQTIPAGQRGSEYTQTIPAESVYIQDYTHNMDEVYNKSSQKHKNDIGELTRLEINLNGVHHDGRMESERSGQKILCSVHGNSHSPQIEDDFIPPLSDVETQRVKERLAAFNEI